MSSFHDDLVHGAGLIIAVGCAELKMSEEGVFCVNVILRGTK